MAYFGLLRLLEFPTFTSTWAYTQISLGLSSARRILELINRETDLDQNAAGYSQPMRGEIEFRGVTFIYPDSNDSQVDGSPVLEDISFKVQPGQTVAIVGQTGAGKTTLVEADQPHLRRHRRPGPGGRGGRARLEPGLPALSRSPSSSRISSSSPARSATTSPLASQAATPVEIEAAADAAQAR